MPNHTNRELYEACFAYLVEIFEQGTETQADIINATFRIRGFIDAAVQFQGMLPDTADDLKRSLMSFALLHEERLEPKPHSRGRYID